MTGITAINMAFDLNFSSRARTVFLFLAKLSNAMDACFPSIVTIMERCRLSESTVRRALSDLQSMGLVSKESRFRKTDKGQTSNLYILHATDTSEQESLPQTACDMAEDASPTSVASMKPALCQPDTPRVSPVIPQELEYINLNLDSSSTDRHAYARDAQSAQPNSVLPVTEEKTLEEILDRCELPYFDPNYRVMFYQAVIQLYFAESVRSGKAKVPQRWVRRCLGNLGYHVLEAARNKLEHNRMGEVCDSGAYVRTVVFNCIMELESDLLCWRWRDVG